MSAHGLTLHFGAVSTFVPHPADGEPLPDVMVDGHSDPQSRHDLTLHRTGQVATVDGSWLCWGEDPDAEHDGSLHIVIDLPDGDDLAPADVQAMRDDLAAHVQNGDRLVDYAILSEGGDWSQQVAVFRFDPDGECRASLTDRASSVSRQHWIDTGRYLSEADVRELIEDGMVSA